MNTNLGYSKTTVADTSVLLAHGGTAEINTLDVDKVDGKDATDFILKDSNIPISYTTGYLATSGTNIGAFTNNTSWSYVDVQVKKGDRFLIKGRGGSAPRLYAFADTSNKIISRAADTLQWETAFHEITADQDGRLVACFNTGFAYQLVPLSWVSGYIHKGNITDYYITIAGTTCYINSSISAATLRSNLGLGTVYSHAHTDYVTNVSYNSSTKKLLQSKGGGTATDIVTFGSNAFTNTVIPTDYIAGRRVVNPDASSDEVGLTPFNVFAYKGAGYPLYDDPEFALGTNSVSAYNNDKTNGTVTVTRGKASDFEITDSGNSSGNVIRITSTGAPSPGIGGFLLRMDARANAVFVQIFRAKIPVGRSVLVASNTMGTHYQDKWLTSQAGTDKWEWYARIVHCGNTSPFSTGGHVYLNGDAPGSTTVTWYLSYCNVIDLTKGNYDGLRTKLADLASSATDATNATTANASKLLFYGSATATDYVNSSGTAITSGTKYHKDITVTINGAVLNTGNLFLLRMPTSGTPCSGATININNGTANLGAKAIKYAGGSTGSYFTSGAWYLFIYNGTDLIAVHSYNSNTTYTAMVEGYCSTATATAAKTVTSTNFGNLTIGTVIKVRFTNANTAASAITLNVNSTGAKTIAINGTASSTTNYTLPAGTYFCYYDGTYWDVRTDGSLRAKSFVGNASSSTSAGYLTNTPATNVGSAANALAKLSLKWYSLISRTDAIDGGYYAGSTEGFPVSSNANGILYMGTHAQATEGSYYGGQLGVSSNGRLYYRFITGGAPATTAKGGSWNTIAWSSELSSYVAIAGSTMTGLLTLAGGLNKGIKFADGTYITTVNTNDGGPVMLGGYLRFCNSADWESSRWAGLGYDANNKVINLGLPGDGTVFTKSTAVNKDGTLKLVNISYIKLDGNKGDTYTVYHTGNLPLGILMKGMTPSDHTLNTGGGATDFYYANQLSDGEVGAWFITYSNGSPTDKGSDDAGRIALSDGWKSKLGYSNMTHANVGDILLVYRYLTVLLVPVCIYKILSINEAGASRVGLMSPGDKLLLNTVSTFMEGSFLYSSAETNVNNLVGQTTIAPLITSGRSLIVEGTGFAAENGSAWSADLNLIYVSDSGGLYARHGTGDWRKALQFGENYSTLENTVLLRGNNSSAWVRPMNLFNSSGVVGLHIIMLVGNGNSNKNCGYIGFVYKGNSSNDNFISLGLHSQDDVLNIFGNGNVSIGSTETPTSKLYIAGDVTASGNFYASSDIRLKTNIENISQSIRKFLWKESGITSYGFIALELEEEYPELVTTKQDGYKTVNYNAALCMVIAKLEARITQLEKILSNKLDKLMRLGPTIIS